MALQKISACRGIALVISLLVCSLLLAVPVAAATRTLGDGPSFSAAIIGTNEFVPGQDATIRILVRNTGVNDMNQYGVGTIEPEDTQTTAKMATLGLASASDRITIKTDPQMVGDIPGGGEVVVEFSAKISENATTTNYTLPLNISCRYLPGAVQDQGDEFEFRYERSTTTIPISIRISPQVKAEIIQVVPDQLTTGSEGFINLTIRNAGPENGTKSSVKLLRNGQSPVIPTDSTVFIGDYPSGGVVTCRYKVSISDDAPGQIYPVDVVVSYTNWEGTIVTSAKDTVGVQVQPQPGFSVVSAVPEVSRGADKVIDIVYQNDGAVPVAAASARITQQTPVRIRDNTAYLGDIAPGQTARARFVLHADGTAEPGQYSFESTIRYRDAEGTSIESDPFLVTISVVPQVSGLAAVPGGLITIVACAVAGIIISISFVVYRKKRANP
jgi:hypothetical protein